MKVLVNDEISKEKWIDIISKSSFSTPFQTHDFYTLFKQLSDYSVLAIAIEEEGALQCLINIIMLKEAGLKSYFTRRGIVYGGPVLINNNRSALEFLLEHVKRRIKNKVIYTEIRNLNDYSYYKDIFSNHGWEYQSYLNFRLNCTSDNLIWSKLNKNRQRQIKKSIINGTIIKEAESIEEVKEFYSLLEGLYRRKIKKPLLNFCFFKLFFEMNLGKLLLIQYDNKIVGGILCPILPGKAIYEFYICGLDKEIKSIYPSVMATYAAIQYGLKKNLMYFDFMGAGRPGINYTVRDFKEKFGGDLVEYGRFRKLENIFLFKLGNIVLKTMKSVKCGY